MIDYLVLVVMCYVYLKSMTYSAIVIYMAVVWQGWWCLSNRRKLFFVTVQCRTPSEAALELCYTQIFRGNIIVKQVHVYYSELLSWVGHMAFMFFECDIFTVSGISLDLGQ